MACSGKQQQPQQPQQPGKQVIDMFENSDLLQCAVCFNTFRKAKVLPCHHSFCLECLDQTFKVYQEKSCGGGGGGSGPGRLIVRMPCPTCRTPVRIPRAGIPALPDDFRVAQLIDMLSEVSKIGDFSGKPSPPYKEDSLKIGSTLPHLVVLCELCKVMNKEVAAKKYCSSCSKLVCDECIYKHGSGVFREHKLYDIVLCMLHPTEVIKYFCKDCEKTACLACLIEYHKDHAATEIQDEFRSPDDVDRFIHQLVHNKVDHCTDLITKLEQISETLCGKYIDANVDVQNRMQALMLYVEMHGRDMVEFLETELSKQKEEIGDRIEQLEIQRAVLENFKRKSNTDIFSSMKQLNEKCAEIQDIMSEDMKNFFLFSAEKSFPELGMFIPARLDTPQLVDKPKTKLLHKPVWLRTIHKPFCEHIPTYYDIKSLAALPDSNMLVILVGNSEECHVCIMDLIEQKTVRCVNPMVNALAVFPANDNILLLSEQQIKMMPLDTSLDREVPIDVHNNYGHAFSSCCFIPGAGRGSHKGSYCGGGGGARSIGGGKIVATIAEENLIVTYALTGELLREYRPRLGETDVRNHEPRAILYHRRRGELIVHDSADDALYRFSVEEDDDGGGAGGGGPSGAASSLPPSLTYRGALLDEAGTKKKFIGAFSEPVLLEATLGNIMVMEKYNRKVNLFTPEGRYLHNLFQEYENKDDLPNQEGAAVNSQGQLFIALGDNIAMYQLYD